MAEYPGLVGGSYEAQSQRASAALTMNQYVESTPQPGGRPKLSLYPFPGVVKFADTVSGPGRATLEHKGRAFAVLGSSFVEFDAFGSVTVRGTVAVNSYPATLCTNGDGGGEIFVTSGNNGYIYDLASHAFTQVRTGGTAIGDHIDGYFLAFDAETSKMSISGLLDGLTWDPTQFAQRSIKPDPWVSMKVVGRYVWLLGEKTSEVWYNTGGFPFPFAPHPSGLVDFGCGARHSPSIVDGGLTWLASTADGATQVVRAVGFTPDVISTRALESAITDAGAISDAIGDTIQHRGHTFYVLTMPSANKTAAFDTQTGWFDLGTWRADLAEFHAWRPAMHCVAFGKSLVLDRAGPHIYYLTDASGYDVEGLTIRRVRRPATLSSENRRVSVPSIELDVEPGLGTLSGQGEYPMVSMRVSRDGGKTWGPERWRSSGRRGEYGTRVRWLRNGSARQFVPEFVMTDPIPWRIFGAFLGDA